MACNLRELIRGLGLSHNMVYRLPHRLGSGEQVFLSALFSLFLKQISTRKKVFLPNHLQTPDVTQYVGRANVLDAPTREINN